jgi:hypothetical protein
MIALPGSDFDSKLIQFGPVGDMVGIQGLGITGGIATVRARIWIETHS